jgi:hypothetical protein
MRRHQILTFLCAIMMLTMFAPHARGQAQKDPLNDDEVDQVRELGDRPNERLKLYAKFIEQRITVIKQLSTEKTAENRSALLRAKIEEFTRLADELQDNLDTYDQEHADIRKALKELVPQSEKWQPVLNQPGPDPGYDFVRKTAVEAAKSVSDQTKELQKDQEKYFAEHKDQAGKNGTGPQ